MKVLQREQMPDGTNIVREEWSENYSFEAYGSMIAAYPRNRYGETFRLSVCNSNISYISPLGCCPSFNLQVYYTTL